MQSFRRKKCLLVGLYFLLALFLREKISAIQQINMHFIFLELSRLSQMNRRRLMMYRRMLSVANPRLNNRRVWVWPRPQHWFQLLLTRRDMDPLWKLHFRVTRPTFVRMREPVSVEKRVAVSLWRFATGNSFKTFGLQFGLGKSTAKTVCCEFENALISRKDQFINFPLTRRHIEEQMNEFIDEYGIPQTVGAIDGCHIEINDPPQNKEDYYNRKQHYSVILQAIVDCSLKFLHVSVGYPGSIHDARVLRLSGLFDLGNNQQILESPSRVINGTEVPPLIVGDSAYPLLKWLIKPYADRGRLSPEERKFNIKLSAMRSVVERAFGMLKLHWRPVYKKVEQKTRTLKKTVIAACFLHDICIVHGHLCDDNAADSSSDSEDDEGQDIRRENSTEVRALKNYVWANL